MTIRIPHSLALLICGVFTLNLAHAGVPASDSKASKQVELTEPEPALGSVTVGGRFSNHLTDGYMDLLLPVWAQRDNVLAVSSRITINDRDQDVYSFGAVSATAGSRPRRDLRAERILRLHREHGGQPL